jgi:hypothetical protein
MILLLLLKVIHKVERDENVIMNNDKVTAQAIA